MWQALHTKVTSHSCFDNKWPKTTSEFGDKILFWNGNHRKIDGGSAPKTIGWRSLTCNVSFLVGIGMSRKRKLIFYQSK